MHSERSVGRKDLGLLGLVYDAAPRNGLLNLKFGTFHLRISCFCPEVIWTQE